MYFTKKLVKDGKAKYDSIEMRLRSELLVYLMRATFIEHLYMGCLTSMKIGHYIRFDETFDRKLLAEEIAKFDALDDKHRPLSELVLQRKITEEDDKLDTTIEVEFALWEYGRMQIAKRQNISRTTG